MIKVKRGKQHILVYHASLGLITIIWFLLDILLIILSIINNGFSLEVSNGLVLSQIFLTGLFLINDILNYYEIAVSDDYLELYYFTLRGFKYLKFDLSEIELNIVPAIAKNPEYINIKKNGIVVKKFYSNIFKNTKRFVTLVNEKAGINKNEGVK